MERQEGIHPRILGRIRGAEERQQRMLAINFADNVNRESVQYLADFLSGETHQVMELDLTYVSLVQPSDGALNVLCSFFTNQASLSKVELRGCGFGNEQEASLLLAAFQTNRTVTDLTIYGIRNLEGAAFGTCISDVLQNTVHLQRLELGRPLEEEAIRAFQPGLRTNRHLKLLAVCRCFMGDAGIRLIVDALVGNTSMEVLDISDNYNVTSIDDITRLLEVTRLKKIDVRDNHGLFDDNHEVQHFTHVLHQHTSLEELPGLDLDRFPFIRNLLDRNCSLRRAKELLTLQPRTAMPIGSKSGIWYKAMEKLAPDSSGASSIFHILQTRPAILEKQLRQPPQQQQPSSAVTHQQNTAAEQEHGAVDDDDDDDNKTASTRPRKRARRF